jgi:hypothetical protein
MLESKKIDLKKLQDNTHEVKGYNETEKEGKMILEKLSKGIFSGMK